MTRNAQYFLEAARVPASLQPQSFGPWTISRHRFEACSGEWAGGWPDYTVLRRISIATIHVDELGVVVMEDSKPELSRHLPIWMNAGGRVLVTGLGLGCVVRGLLASPDVEAIDVVELDKSIIRVVGPEFYGNPKVTIHHGDALSWRPPTGARWDYAWHDLWVEGEGLQLLHAQLFVKFREWCQQQGAWAFPREFARIMPWQLLGAPQHGRRLVSVSKRSKERGCKPRGLAFAGSNPSPAHHP
jgi:hypothetical protein